MRKQWLSYKDEKEIEREKGIYIRSTYFLYIYIFFSFNLKIKWGLLKLKKYMYIYPVFFFNLKKFFS